MKTVTLVIGIAGIILSCFACTGSKSNRANLIDPNLRYQADTMFSHRRNVITKELDSLCLMEQPAMVQNMVDSLVEEQLAQINEILQKGSEQ